MGNVAPTRKSRYENADAEAKVQQECGDVNARIVCVVKFEAQVLKWVSLLKQGLSHACDAKSKNVFLDDAL